MKIALIGKAAVGKDAIALYLNEVYGFHRFAFADRLKEFDVELFGKSQGKNRARLQQFGQACREIDPLVWIKQLDRDIQDRIRLSDETDPNIVITDTRQENELEYCRQNGFYIVKIVASLDTRIQRMKERGDRFNPEDLGHETETALDSFHYDYRIDNNGRFNHATQQIDYVIRDLQALAKS